MSDNHVAPDEGEFAGRVVVVGRIGTVTRCAVPQGLTTRTATARNVERWWAGPAWAQANVAAHHGALTVLISAVGHDVGQSAIMADARHAGFTAHLSSVMHRPSDSFVEMLIEGTWCRLWVPGASEVWPGEDQCAAACANLGPADVVVVDSATAAPVVARTVAAARAVDAHVVVWASDCGAMSLDVVAGADVVIVDEEGALQAADQGVHPASLLVLFGASGAAWNEQQYVVKGRDTWDGLDVAGTHDAFVGAFAAQVAAGATRDESVTAGLRASVNMLGVHGPLPHGGAVERDALTW